MLYHINGKLSELEIGLAVIECFGIGFAVNITANTAAMLKVGESVKLYISESIGENNFDLFGFYTKAERRCFDMLISVSGIGPKAAMSILSHNTPEGLALAVMSEDEKALTVAPGIGKKIAKRVILELKDKLGKDTLDGAVKVTASPVVQKAGGEINDALAGLAILGYSSAEITPILKSADTTSMTAEQIIKLVLKQMVK